MPRILVLSVKLGAPISRRRCGSHPEYAHSVYKYALNGFSFSCLWVRKKKYIKYICDCDIICLHYNFLYDNI